jgi:transcriptional regulator with XRE-family HTH domain
MDKLAQSIGRNARAARGALGLTQSEIAERAGLATEVYGRLERGTMLPSVPTLVKLAHVLQVKPGQLLDETDEAQRRSASKPQAKSEIPELRRIIALLADADASTLRRVAIVVKAMLS